LSRAINTSRQLASQKNLQGGAENSRYQEGTDEEQDDFLHGDSHFT